ncbi:MAG: hypothetical protein K2K99_09515 [Muribaculaceae bacterium]|nr:hypothetical protein [Muribaculaceae bacterium]MDE7144341.1 hypothetical protein [Muribaculaceae bacterium]
MDLSEKVHGHSFVVHPAKLVIHPCNLVANGLFQNCIVISALTLVAYIIGGRMAAGIGDMAWNRVERALLKFLENHGICVFLPIKRT